jgi:hypothetical protein
MTRLEITIELDNDAFARTPRIEVARILEEIARKSRDGRELDDRKLIDCNGNTCGSMKLVD